MLKLTGGMAYGSKKDWAAAEPSAQRAGIDTERNGRMPADQRQNRVEMGKRSFPKIKRQTTYSRLHYFQDNITMLIMELLTKFPFGCETVTMSVETND